MRRALPYTGLAGVGVIWTTLLAATAASGFDLFGDLPLSYVGTEPGSALLFTAGMAATALLLVAFHGHVRARFDVSWGFSVAMLVGLAGQLVAAFVPVGGDTVAHRVHTVSALVLGASLPLLMWRFAAALPRGRRRRAGYRLFWAEVAACAAGFYLSAMGVAAVAEVLPAAAFHAWVVTVTFWGLDRSRAGRVAPRPQNTGNGKTYEDRRHHRAGVGRPGHARPADGRGHEHGAALPGPRAG
ncbi:MAG: hypothetical protein AB1673_12980 [Actinomycetota bacterium]|jgi:hypothetical protein